MSLCFLNICSNSFSIYSFLITSLNRCWQKYEKYQTFKIRFLIALLFFTEVYTFYCFCLSAWYWFTCLATTFSTCSDSGVASRKPLSKARMSEIWS